MFQELIMKMQDQKTTKVLNYMVFNLSALLTMMMLAEPFAECGAERVTVLPYEMIKYLPQAIMISVAPFLNYITYLEPIPKRWKQIKLIIIGVLFAVSLITTTKFGLPVLEAEFGNAEKQLVILPVAFYINLAIGIMEPAITNEGEGKRNEW